MVVRALDKTLLPTRTGRDIRKKVLMVQLPTETGMLDAGCRSVVSGHDLHVSLQVTMDNYVKELSMAKIANDCRGL